MRDREEKSACLIRRPNHSLIAVPVSGITMETTVIDNEQCWNIHAPKTPTIIIINNRKTYLLSTFVWASARSRLLPRYSTIVGHVLIFFVDFFLLVFIVLCLKIAFYCMWLVNWPMHSMLCRLIWCIKSFTKSSEKRLHSIKDIN